MSDQDAIFFRNFSLLVFGLLVFIVIIAIVSGIMNYEIYGDTESQKDRSAIQESIQSVARVNTDPNAQPVVQAVATAAAFDGSLDGQMIYDNVCMACHTTGAGGAPKLEAAAWEGRMDKGMDMLVSNAVVGYQGEAGIMPAKGGRTDLTDEQVKVAVEYMLDNLN